MKNLMISLTIMLSLYSCSYDLGSNPNYYRFNRSDYNYIPASYNVIGKMIKFKNTQNEEIFLKVLNYEITKETGGGFIMPMLNFDEYIEYHYYNKLHIELVVTDYTGGLIDCSQKFIEIENYGGSTLKTSLNSSCKPDPYCTSSTDDRFELPCTFEEMNINGFLYTKVLRVFNNSDAHFHPDYTFDTVFYDCKHGFIAFRDSKNDILFTKVSE